MVTNKADAQTKTDKNGYVRPSFQSADFGAVNLKMLITGAAAVMCGRARIGFTSHSAANLSEDWYFFAADSGMIAH